MKVCLPLASALLLAWTIRTVASTQHDHTILPPPAEPPTTPFTDAVACVGVLEPRSESIDVGSPLPGLVVEVCVTTGQAVKKDEPLFRLDDRQVRADLRVRQAELASARTQLRRLTNSPRAEEVTLAQARIKDAEVALADARDEYHRNIKAGPGASAEIVSKSKAVSDRARSRLEQARTELALLTPWEEDLEVSRRNVARAESAVRQAETELERLTLRSPIDGTVLQVLLHAGETVGTPANRSLMVLGDVERLRVRVSIDEHAIPRFRPGAPAQALVVGHPALRYPLTFVRVDPYVIPKKSLTGDNRERVDTRVLQAVYELVPPPGAPLYVGQQVNVYLQASDPILPTAGGPSPAP